GLPDLPFLLLSITHHAVDPPRVSVVPGAVRHAARNREALPERPRGDLDAGRVVLAGVSLEMPLELAEAQEVREGEVPSLGHQRVDDGRHVPDREVPEIPSRIVEPARIDAQLVEEEDGSEVGRGERPAAMPALRPGEERDAVPADEQLR